MKSENNFVVYEIESKNRNLLDTPNARIKVAYVWLFLPAGNFQAVTNVVALPSIVTTKAGSLSLGSRSPRFKGL